MANRHFLSHQKKLWPQIKYKRNLPLFLDMRLGKTFLTINWSITRRFKNINLIVCPPEVIKPWQIEFEKEGIQSQPLIGSSKKKFRTLQDGIDKGLNYFITNYEALKLNGKNLEHVKLKSKPTELCDIYWDQLIFDESTKIRKPNSAITKICLKKLNARFKAILTGLPNPEGTEDFICQLLFLYGKIMGCTDFYQWRHKHMTKLPYGGWVTKRKSAKILKQFVKENCLVMSRKDAGVDYGKIREIRHVYAPNKIHKACREALTEFEIGDKMSNHILAPLSWISKICGGRFEEETLQHDLKLKEIKNLLSSELKRQPIIFAAKHTVELYAIKELLDTLKLKSAICKGQQDNSTFIEKFMTGKLDYLICQPKAIKMGVDLSRADTIIFYSNWYDYEIRTQFEDRVIHPLKKVPVLIVDIVIENTLDEAMPLTLQKKGINAKRFYNELYTETKARIIA